jgi:hypothetical protein
VVGDRANGRAREGLKAAGEVGGRGCSQRGEVFLQAFAGELVDGDGVVDVLETVLAEGGAGRGPSSLGQQMRGGVGDDHLGAVGGGADAGCEVHLCSHIASCVTVGSPE